MVFLFMLAKNLVLTLILKNIFVMDLFEALVNNSLVFMLVVVLINWSVFLSLLIDLPVTIYYKNIHSSHIFHLSILII